MNLILQLTLGCTKILYKVFDFLGWCSSKCFRRHDFQARSLRFRLIGAYNYF